MKDYDLFVRFKDLSGAKNISEMAEMLEIKQPYISQVKMGNVNLSTKVARKMWKIAGDEISLMWGRLQEEKLKKG